MSEIDPESSDEAPHLGRYELLGEIASGGMATVYLARTVGHGGFTRRMAIKRLHPHLETDDDFVRMFLDEARLAARIRHPNVVATLDVEDHDGLYIVMEYIEGVTLLQLSRAAQRMGDRIPIPVASRIALDTLAGLHAAHELRDEDDQFLNLVHRDVSPQNVLLGTDGAARLTDFGIAKAASRLSMTRDGQLKGKISYMAPEQTRRGEVDRRADVFAMGIVVWELLAGRRLFSGETDVEVLNQLLFEPIPRLKDHAPTLPSMLEQTVMRALDRDPNARYATAMQFADAIERATRMLGGPANHRVVAAFIQKVAGERIARERGRIAAGIPLSEAASTGNFRALDATGTPAMRARTPLPSHDARDPRSMRPRLRAPTMGGPVYSPDEPDDDLVAAQRQLRRPSPLRPPTMPAMGPPRRDSGETEAYKDTLHGVGSQSSTPPAIIEFAGQPQPPQAPLRARTPAPIAPLDGPPSAPDLSDELETRSMPVSMLLGPPQGATPATFPPPIASAPPPPVDPSPAPAPLPVAPPAVAPPAALAVAAPVAALPTPPPAPAPSGSQFRTRLLIALALLVAMALGALLTLYLTGFFSRPNENILVPAPTPPVSAVDAGNDLAPLPVNAVDATVEAAAIVAPDDVTAVDASAVVDDAAVDASATDGSAVDDAADATTETHDAAVDASAVAEDAASDGDAGRRRRRRRRDEAVAPTGAPTPTLPDTPF